MSFSGNGAFDETLKAMKNPSDSSLGKMASSFLGNAASSLKNNTNDFQTSSSSSFPYNINGNKEEAGKGGASFWKGAFGANSNTADNNSSGLSMFSNNQSPWWDTMGLSTVQRYAAFAICWVIAILFFVIAFFNIIFPTKFVVSFCFANSFIFLSFGFLLGFAKYAKHLSSKERIPFTSAFLLSTFLMLFIVFMKHNFILKLVGGIFQITSMVVFVISYLPGGTAGIKMLLPLSSSFF